MMKTLKEDAKTGIPKLDNQYEELLKIIHKLNSKCKTQDDIWDVLISIENYIRNHFSKEEDYMKSLDYSEYESHKLSHEKFIEEYKEISEEITSYESIDKILPSLKAFIENWVKNHFQEADKKLAMFLKGHKE